MDGDGGRLFGAWRFFNNHPAALSFVVLPPPPDVGHVRSAGFVSSFESVLGTLEPYLVNSVILRFHFEKRERYESPTMRELLDVWCALLSFNSLLHRPISTSICRVEMRTPRFQSMPVILTFPARQIPVLSSIFCWLCASLSRRSVRQVLHTDDVIGIDHISSPVPLPTR